MHLKFIFTICVTYHIQLGLSKTGINNKIKDELESFVCSSEIYNNDAAIKIECVAKFSYFRNELIAECVRIGENDVAILVKLLKNRKSYFNESFFCESNSNLSFYANFSNGEPSKENIIVLPQRSVENYLDSSTYKYKLNFMFYHQSKFRVCHNCLVKYSIFSMHNPSIELNMFLDIFPQKDDNDIDSCELHKLIGGNIVLPYDDDMVTIPCIHFKNTAVVTLSRKNNHFPVDNTSVSYDHIKGFQVNATYFGKDFANGKLPLLCASYSLCQAAPIEFYLVRRERNYSPVTELYVDGPKFNILTGVQEISSSITLSCNDEALPLVSIKQKTTTGKKHDKPKINVTYSTSFVDKSWPMYFATCQVPYLNETERDQVSGWLDSDAKMLGFECDMSEDRKIEWTIHYDHEKPPLHYSEEFEAFVCQPDSNLPHVNGSFLRLAHWECQNVFQCQIVTSHCLGTLTNDVTGKEENTCMQFLQSDICNIKGCSNSKNYEDWDWCKATRPAKKGIVQCIGVFEGEYKFDIHKLYFQGFDNKIYVDIFEKPPLNATLKLSKVNGEEYFYVGGNFSFRCEAHSYFYAEGIHWFFKYKDGRKVPPPPGLTTYVKTERQDMYNPESTVIFYLDDVNLAEVICSVPLLHSDGWDDIHTTVDVVEPVPPKIINEKTVLYLEENINGQSITCQVEGIPLPKIIWKSIDKKTKTHEVVQQPVKILEDKILMFPYYNATFLGEYTCYASSFLGNDSRAFTVKDAEKATVVKNNNKLNYTLTALGFLTVIVAASMTAYYLRLKKRNRREEMAKIIRLVEGVEINCENANVEDKNGDPLMRPFQKCYEMQKDNFSIDWSMPLGKGEFGAVYRGTLTGVDGPIAIKMLKKDAKIEHLRSLASELKILMSIGHHKNLVALVGAYKQELERGILYVAVEYCGLGSMQSYLRTNKHIFLRCPKLLSSVGNYQQVVHESVSTFHSYEILLKWSKQITCGMEYLGSKHIVHSDLALRNVLLTTEGNAKITDFGLSRRMYNYIDYIKKGDDPLPWQWLAPESITLQIFSSKSDVWAYGITLWEIFSFGEVPYPTLSYNKEFLDMIQHGRRNSQPKYASDYIYQVMEECWKYDPEERPSFSSLKSTLQDLFLNPPSKNVANIEIHISKQSSDPTLNSSKQADVLTQIDGLQDQMSIEEGYTILAEFRG